MWTPESRAAALEARRANAGSTLEQDKERLKTLTGGKPMKASSALALLAKDRAESVAQGRAHAAHTFGIQKLGQIFGGVSLGLLGALTRLNRFGGHR